MLPLDDESLWDPLLPSPSLLSLLLLPELSPPAIPKLFPPNLRTGGGLAGVPCFRGCFFALVVDCCCSSSCCCAIAAEFAWSLRALLTSCASAELSLVNVPEFPLLAAA